MGIEKIAVDRFVSLAQDFLVVDVRSEAEFEHAHVPGAVNLPLFNNEERKTVGTLYKQTSREAAIKKGLDIFGPKMRAMVEFTERLLEKSRRENRTVVVHCWRGGMRSAGVAWLLDLYGFKVYTLVGGYKAFRKWVLEQFEKSWPFTMLGGYTGSGKTMVIGELVKEKEAVVDLEGLAGHRGSAFGNIGLPKQPSQEMFENKLAVSLHQTAAKHTEKRIWLEDESQRIGTVNIPNAVWHTMRNSPVVFLDIPFEQRLDYLVSTYGKLDKEALGAAILRIQKRLGGLETKTALANHLAGDTKACFRILLKYYDKLYGKGLENRPDPKPEVKNINTNTVDPKINTKLILDKDYGRN